MSRDTSSVIVRADMSAFEFREAAWAAVDADDDDDRCEPDPSVLSDRTLAIVMRYRDRDPDGAGRWRRSDRRVDALRRLSYAQGDE